VDKETAARIRSAYGLPEWVGIGSRLVFFGSRNPMQGTIVGTDAFRWLVAFDKRTNPVVIHPTWQVEYPDPTEGADRG
jgi:hypothetical protein